MGTNSDPLASNSYNPTDNANFTAAPTKVAKVKGTKAPAVKVPKLTPKVKMPKGNAGGLKGLLTSTKMGASAMKATTPKVTNPKMPSTKASKYVV
jgi:hypothetical protein